MDNFEIEALLHNNKHTHKVFGAVLAADQLQQVQPTNKTTFYIVNTERLNSIGQHWYCLGISNHEIEIFDSTAFLGLKNSYLLAYLSNHESIQFKFNKCQYQSKTTAVCGLYCCCFIYYRALGYTLNDFLKKFDNSKNFLDNDKLIVKLFLECF